MQPESRQHRRWIISGVEPEGIRDALDLGCGRGLDVAELRHTLGPEVFLTGLDRHEDRLVEARRHTPDDRARFMTGDLEKPLPFPDASFDLVWSNNVFECLTDPARFLDEIHRVLRPGGQLVVAHWDWDSQVFDGTDRDHVRRIVHAWCDWQQPWMCRSDGWMGRRLGAKIESDRRFTGELRTRTLMSRNHGPESFAHARWKELEHLVGEGLISPADWERFRREQDDLAARGAFIYAITGWAWFGRRD